MLLPKAEPSKFDCFPDTYKSSASVPPKRKSPTKRKLFEPKSKTSLDKAMTEASQLNETFDQNSGKSSNDIETEIGTFCNNCFQLENKIAVLENKNCSLENEMKKLSKELERATDRLHEYERKEFSYNNMRKDEDEFKSYTGLTPEKFDILFEYVDPGSRAEMMQYYDAALRKTGNRETRSNQSEEKENSGKKPGPPPTLNVRDQLFMFIVWVRCAFTQKHISYLFKCPTSTCSRYLITWANYLFFMLGSIPIWPSKSQVKQMMPDSFKETYPSTRCIIDCTEIFAQVPSSLGIQSAMYSSYKHHVTYKGLIGMAPSGAVTFISALYPGCLSEKEIVTRSGFLNQAFWEQGDSVMADGGFTIGEELKKLGVALNIPAFLDGREQLEKEEVIESQTIASVRIHVECLMARLKKFRILKMEIPLNLHRVINQVWTVCCLLCNFSEPLIKPK